MFHRAAPGCHNGGIPEFAPGNPRDLNATCAKNSKNTLQISPGGSKRHRPRLRMQSPDYNSAIPCLEGWSAGRLSAYAHQMDWTGSVSAPTRLSEAIRSPDYCTTLSRKNRCGSLVMRFVTVWIVPSPTLVWKGIQDELVSVCLYSVT